MNKSELQAYNRQYYLENRDKILSRARTRWREQMAQTPEQRREYMREYRQKNKEKLRIYNIALSHKHKDRWNASKVGRDLEVKVEVLTYYGKGHLACILCGVDDLDVLSLDHVEDNGAQERRSLGRNHTGGKMYRYLKKNQLSPGYQTLCANCQTKKEMIRRRIKYDQAV